MQAFEVRFHTVLCELIALQRNKEAQHLASGRASDWGDYQRRVGILEGLNLARELANSLLDKAREGERQLEQMQDEREPWQH